MQVLLLNRIQNTFLRKLYYFFSPQETQSLFLLSVEASQAKFRSKTTTLFWQTFKHFLVFEAKKGSTFLQGFQTKFNHFGAYFRTKFKHSCDRDSDDIWRWPSRKNSKRYQAISSSRKDQPSPRKIWDWEYLGHKQAHPLVAWAQITWCWRWTNKAVALSSAILADEAQEPGSNPSTGKKAFSKDIHALVQHALLARQWVFHVTHSLVAGLQFSMSSHPGMLKLNYSTCIEEIKLKCPNHSRNESTTSRKWIKKKKKSDVKVL